MEERFVLDNNNNIIDFEDKTDKYCLSQEDVCNVLNKQHQRIAELEQEFAELKEKAITTHFKLGQEIWFVGYSSIQSWIIKGIELKYIKDKLCEICRLGHHGTDDYSCCVMPFDSDRCFATEQEAQEKLKEIQGNE